ncbi:MAG: pseudouridine synthase [Acidimicrobiales bacterium]
MTSPSPPSNSEAGVSSQGERLQKVLAAAGIASRRRCEELIAEGRVRVNGVTASLGKRVDSRIDTVSVDGVRIATDPGLVYYALNKPAGVLSSAADPAGRPTVVSLVPPDPRVFPVGRLDADSEGLIFLCNDGGLAYTLTHPSKGVDKEYLVRVHGHPKAGAIRRMREGIDLDGRRTAPAKVSLVEADLLKVTIHEGRNRQIRRMAEAVGHPVRQLVRTRIGPVRLAGLTPGAYRLLSQEEVRKLERAGGGSPHGSPGGARLGGQHAGSGTDA